MCVSEKLTRELPGLFLLHISLVIVNKPEGRGRLLILVNM